MINLVKTRLHDRNSGAIVGGAHQIEFSGAEIVVLSLSVDNAASISDIEFELVPGGFDIDNFSINNGNFYPASGGTYSTDTFFPGRRR